MIIIKCQNFWPIFLWLIFIISSLLVVLQLNFYVCSDTEISLDPQVPFIPSVEVLVKAFLVMSPAALKVAPDSFIRIIFCAHHPCLVGSAKRDAVWKVILYILYSE